MLSWKFAVRLSFYKLSILISVLYNALVGEWPNDGGFGSWVSEGMTDGLGYVSNDDLVVAVDSVCAVIHGPVLDFELLEYYRQATGLGSGIGTTCMFNEGQEVRG